MTDRLLGRIGAVAISLVVLAGSARGAEQAFTPSSGHQPEVRIGEVVFTLIGQVTNTPPNLSAQYGYLTGIAGMDDLFVSAPENESSAFFTFYNEATTTVVRQNGPMTIIEREGTTTIYYDDVPNGSFSDPDSFRDGQPVLVMTLKQQVILDTAATTFSVVIANQVTEANPFRIDGRSWTLGRRKDNLTWSITGRLNAAPPPNGHFAAYVVKAQGN